MAQAPAWVIKNEGRSLQRSRIPSAEAWWVAPTDFKKMAQDYDQALRERDEEMYGAARNMIRSWIGDHEMKMHGGGTCIEERINAIAFIAHALGLAAEDDGAWEFMRSVIRNVYERHSDHSSG
jgi:hypothetical protein